MFRVGRPWGEGRKIYEDGRVIEGFWENNKFVELKRYNFNQKIDSDSGDSQSLELNPEKRKWFIDIINDDIKDYNKNVTDMTEDLMNQKETRYINSEDKKNGEI